jgi:hypothetical protein
MLRVSVSKTTYDILATLDESFSRAHLREELGVKGFLCFSSLCNSETRPDSIPNKKTIKQD